MRKLIVNDGRRERELVLVGRIVVGRDPICDVSEADPLLSRRHAEFTTDGNTIVARDLGSRNGIYVNGARVAEQRLRSGDVIQIGHLKVRYVEDSAPLVAAPELADVDATAVIHRTSRESAPALPNSPAAVRPVPPPSHRNQVRVRVRSRGQRPASRRARHPPRRPILRDRLDPWIRTRPGSCRRLNPVPVLRRQR